MTYLSLQFTETILHYLLMIRKRYLWGFIFLSISIALSCLISLITFNAPIFMDSAQLGNNSYYIVCNINIFEARGFEFLYKCDRNGLACEETSYSYWDGSSCDNNSYLIADHKNNEVDVVSGERGDKSSILQYAYGALPRYYDDYIQLDNHMFYLARVDHAYHPLTYILYECNLDNTSCNQLPCQYQPQSGDSAYNNIYIDSDETTDRVSVLKYPIANPEKLIYTYTVSSQHPQCYVDGCTTTNGQK